MGVDHGGTRETSPPRIWSGGDANANCPPRFCHIGTKMSVLWPSKYAKIRFRPGLPLIPLAAGGAHDAPPDPLVDWKGDTPPNTPPYSARTQFRRSPCVPQKSSQIYAYGSVVVRLQSLSVVVMICVTLVNTLTVFDRLYY